MTVPDSLRKYVLLECNNEMDSKFKMHRTPGLVQGAYLSFKDVLTGAVIRLTNHNENLYVRKPIRIKDSGDGTRVSRISNFFVIPFSVVSETIRNSHFEQQQQLKLWQYWSVMKTMRTKIMHAVHYFRKLRTFETKVKISVAGNVLKVELFLGGDMKFLQVIMGLSDSTSTCVCVWCRVHKSERGNISRPWDFYHNNEQKRTVNYNWALKKWSVKCNVQTSIKYRSGSRVFGVPLRNLIDDALDKHQMATVLKQPADNLEILTEQIRSCGVSFSIWTDRTGNMDWPSLTGAELLPDELLLCIHEDTREKTVDLWKDFHSIYRNITSFSILPDMSQQFLETRIGKTKVISVSKRYTIYS